MEQQYIDLRAVTGVVVLDEKTPGGNEMVSVNFEDGTKETMPKKRFEIIVSDKPTDFTTVAKKIEDTVGAFLYSALNEYGIKWGEVNKVGDAMVAFVDRGYAKAHDILFKVEKFDIPLIEINNILVKHAKSEQNNDGTPPSGSGVDPKN